MSEQWHGIDDLIVRARISQALHEICGRFDVTLKEAFILFGERYDVLRELRPDDFALPPDEYGRGVYT
jgi:hypothetical protein